MQPLAALLIAFLLLLPVAVGAQGQDTPLNPSVAAEENPSPQSPLKAPGAVQHYPKIVLYSTSWCPHCKAAKEYFTSHDIPFINRDVEMDDEAMQLLTEKYKSKGVPVIVIGNDDVVLKGFDEAAFAKALKKYTKK